MFDRAAAQPGIQLRGDPAWGSQELQGASGDGVSTFKQIYSMKGNLKHELASIFLPPERSYWCLSRWVVLLDKPAHPFLCCSIFPCSQRTVLSSYNSDIGDFKSGSILKKKTETSTWFLLQRQADMHVTMRMDVALGYSLLHFVPGRDLLPGVE